MDEALRVLKRGGRIVLTVPGRATAGLIRGTTRSTTW